jgi:hypothetical protein
MLAPAQMKARASQCNRSNPQTNPAAVTKTIVGSICASLTYTPALARKRLARRFPTLPAVPGTFFAFVRLAFAGNR